MTYYARSNNRTRTRRLPSEIAYQRHTGHPGRSSRLVHTTMAHRCGGGQRTFRCHGRRVRDVGGGTGGQSQYRTIVVDIRDRRCRCGAFRADGGDVHRCASRCGGDLLRLAVADTRAGWDRIGNRCPGPNVTVDRTVRLLDGHGDIRSANSGSLGPGAVGMGADAASDIRTIRHCCRGLIQHSRRERG